MFPESKLQLERRLRQVLSGTGLSHPRYGVVIPLVYTAEGTELLLEVRASGISQAGDPCFPGGHLEPGETASQAAARELREELGVNSDPDGFLGQIPTVRTFLGSQANVFVAVISPEEAEHVRPAPAEVARVLRVPIAFFLSHPEAGSYTVDGATIWGMTAGAIRHLCEAWRQAEALS